MSKILKGTITYIFISLLIGYTWNMVVFREMYLSFASSAYRDAPLMHLGLIAVTLEGIALSLIFSKFYTGGKGISEGLIIGLLVGVFSFAYATFVVTAKFTIEPFWGYMSLEFGFGLIHFSLAGILLGYIFNKEKLRPTKI